MTKDCNRGITRSKWFLPSFSRPAGGLPVGWRGGGLRGEVSLRALSALPRLLLLAARSETTRGLRGDARDGPLPQPPRGTRVPGRSPSLP